MDIKNKRIAVVTNASTAIGLSVVEQLVGQDYAVYALIQEQTFNSFNTRLLYRMKGVHVMSILENYTEFWNSLVDQVEEDAEDSGVESQIDLLINIPVFANREFDNLQKVINEGLLLHSTSTVVISDLMSKPNKANIVNMYPITNNLTCSSLSLKVLARSLDTFTEHTAKVYYDNRIYVDALCFEGLDCETLYDTNSSQLNMDNLFEPILEVLHYIAEGQGGLECGQKFLVTADGRIKETELMAM